MFSCLDHGGTREQPHEKMTMRVALDSKNRNDAMHWLLSAVIVLFFVGIRFHIVRSYVYLQIACGYFHNFGLLSEMFRFIDNYFIPPLSSISTVCTSVLKMDSNSRHVFCVCVIFIFCRGKPFSLIDQTWLRIVFRRLTNTPHVQCVHFCLVDQS